MPNPHRDGSEEEIRNETRKSDDIGRQHWKDIVGRHSVMLALEPRFMFDAAVADTVADVDSQMRDTADAVHADAGEYDHDGGGGENGGDDVKDPLSSFGIDPLSIGTFAAGDINAPTETYTLEEGEDWEFGKEISIEGGAYDRVTVTITLDKAAGGHLTIDPGVYNPHNPIVNIDGDVDAGCATIVMEGSVANINKALQGLKYNGNDNWNGDNSILVQVDGGEITAIDFTVRAQNHLPEITLPDSEIKIPEDAWGFVNGGNSSGFRITDIDAGDKLTVNLVADHEDAFRFHYGSEDTAVYFDPSKITTRESGGKTYWVYTLEGTQGEINALLDRLQYRGAENDFGNDTVTVEVRDERMDEDVWINKDLTVKVTGVNDDPYFDNVIQGGDDFLNGSLAEGGEMVLTDAMLGVRDIEQAAGEIFITITDLPLYGVLMRETHKDSGVWVELDVNSRFTYDDVVNGMIKYVHGGGQVRGDLGSGSGFQFEDSFKFNVNDGAGGYLRDDPASATADNVTFDITLQPVNQKPQVSIEPSGDNPGDPGYYYTKTDATDPDNPKVGISVFEGEEGAVVKFTVADPDQAPGKDYIVYITDVSDLDGTLKIGNVTITQAMILAAKAAGKTGYQISYQDVLDGKLTFTHDGRDGWDGSGFGSTADAHLGQTRDNAFKIVVVDDGGGEYAADGKPKELASDEFTVDIVVKPNNDMPDFKDGLVLIDGDYYPDDGQGGASYVKSADGRWIVPLGKDALAGGFNVADDDSRAGEITYRIENTMTNGGIYLHLDNGTYKALNQGDSFTQQQINEGRIVFIFNSGNADVPGADCEKVTTEPSRPKYESGSPVFEMEDDGVTEKLNPAGESQLRDAGGNLVFEADGTTPVMTDYIQVWTYAQGYYNVGDTLQVTVRDGSYTAWIKDGDTVHREGVESGVGQWINGAYVLTVVNVDFDLKVNFGDPGTPIETGNNYEIGCTPGPAAVADEGQDVSLAGTIDLCYIDKNTGNPSGADTDALKCRVTDVPANGKLVYRKDGVERAINQFDEFFYDDLQYVFYEHNGSENFSDSFVVSVTDASLYLGGSESDSKVTINLNIIPANDTPAVNGGEMTVVEGTEAHQAGDATGTFDQNGEKLTTDHLGISDPDTRIDDAATNVPAKDAGGVDIPGVYMTTVQKVDPVTGEKVFDSDGTTPIYFNTAELRDYYYTSENSDLTFVIVGKPEYGDIWYWNGSGDPPSGIDDNGDPLGAGWIKLGAGEYAVGENAVYAANPSNWDTALAGVRIFTYADLIAGKIRYVHDGRDPTTTWGDDSYQGGDRSDAVNVIVNDGRGFDRSGNNGPHQASVADMVTIGVKIKDVNDAPREAANSPVETPEGGSYDPDFSPSGIGDPNYGTVIDNSHLSHYDAEQANNNLKYEVVTCTAQGTVYLNKGGAGAWIALEAGSTFTQQDIDNGWVKYIHDGTERHGDANFEDVMTWTLRDGDMNGDKWVQGALTLKIMQANDAPTIDKNLEVKNPDNSNKFKETDGYVYITESNRTDNKDPGDYDLGSDYVKDLGGLFQVDDPDHHDLDDPAKGIVKDEMMVTIESSFDVAGASGKFWYGDGGGGYTPGVDIYVKLPDGSLQAITSFNQSEGTIVIVGSKDAVNDFLNHLIFYSEPDVNAASGVNEADLNTVLTVKVTVDDLGNGDASRVNETGQVSQHNRTATSSVDIWISVVNDPPEWNATGPNTPLAVDEDHSVEIKSNGGYIAITDADAFGRTDHTLTISIGNVDNKIVATSSGVEISQPTVVGGKLVYTVTGSLDAINNLLKNISYQPAADWNGADTIAISYKDGVPPGQTAATIDTTINVTVNPINDDIKVDVAGGHEIQFVDEGSNRWTTITGVTVGDIDYTAEADYDLNPGGNKTAYDVITVTVKANLYDNATGTVGAAQGIFRIPGKTDGTTGNLTIGGTGTDTLVLTGTKAEIDAALAQLQYSGETGASNTYIRINVAADDLGNGQDGTNKTTDADNVYVMVGAANDVPAIEGIPGNQVTVAEDDKFTFDGANKITINDPDALDGYLTVTLGVSNGKLSFPGAGTAGWNLANEYYSVSSDGKTVTIHATQEHINALLDGMVYTPTPDHNGADTLVITSNDHGNTNPAGQSAVGEDSRAIAIAVTPVNDAPLVVNGSGAVGNHTAAKAIDEDDASYTDSVSNIFGGFFSDKTDNRQTSGNPAGSVSDVFAGVIVYEVENLSAAGKWYYEDSSSGTGWTELTQASIAAGTGIFLEAGTQLKFEPNPDYNGSAPDLKVYLVEKDTAASPSPYTNGDPVNVATADRGGITIISSNNVTLDLTVRPINDAPTVVVGEESVDYSSGGLSNKITDSANSGKTVSTVFGDSFTDATDSVSGGSNANSLTGVVVVGATGESGKGQWQYHNGGEWKDIPATTGNEGFYLDAATSIRFVPDADYSGAAPALTVHLVDSSTATTGITVGDHNYNPAQPVQSDAGRVDLTHVGDETRFSENTVVLNLAVSEGDNSPVVADGKGAAGMTMVEDKPPAKADASTVGDVFAPSFDNGDKGLDKTTGFAGIVITECVPGTTGTWEYWDGGDWAEIDVSVSGGDAALYLSATTEIRFNPAPHYNSTSPASTLTAHLVENKADGSAPHTNGDTIANFDPGTRYDSNNEAPYTAGAVVVSMIVTPDNDAPAYTAGSDRQVHLEVDEDDANAAGVTVKDMFTTTDHTSSGKPALYDDGLDTVSGGSSAQEIAGIVIVGNTANPATTTEGYWQYKASGGSWTDIDVISTTGDGLFLAADTQVRFVPVGDWNGTPDPLVVHMVDASGASGTLVNGQAVDLYHADGTLNTAVVTKTSAFSKDTATIHVKVNAVNDAPTVATGKENVAWPGSISNMGDDNDNPGEKVEDLFTPSFADSADAVPGGSSANGLLGVVVVGSTGSAGEGHWQYHDGTGWVDIPATSGSNGFYLDADTLIRFNANDDFVGAAPALNVHLVDDSDARGGAGDANYNPAKPAANGGVSLAHTGDETRFSDDTVSLTVSVTNGNNPPRATGPVELVVDEDYIGAGGLSENPADYDDLESIFTGGTTPIFTNGEGSGGGFAGIVVVDCQPDPDAGEWQYWDASGNTWVTIDVDHGSDGKGLYLDPNTAIRFVPKPDYNGPAPDLKAHLVETVGGALPGDANNLVNGATDAFDPTLRDPNEGAPYSKNPVNIGLTVRPINDRPDIGGITDIPAVDEQTPVVIAPGGVLDDVELGVNDKNDWGGAVLTVQRGDGHGGTGTASPDDVFGAAAGGDLELGRGGDGKVYLDGNVVGAFSNGGGVLSVTFADGVTTADANRVLQNITYTYDRDDVPGAPAASGDVTLIYVINDGNAGDNSVPGAQGRGGALTASVEQVVTIVNVADAAAPADDAEAVDLPDSTSTSGNVLPNDRHPDHPAAFTPGDALEVVSVDGTNVSGTVTVPGRYGVLTIGPDGTYTYTVDQNNADVKALTAAGGSLDEVFTYKVQSKGNGDPAMIGTADLTITITAPVPEVSPPAAPGSSTGGSGAGDGGGSLVIDDKGEEEKPVNVSVNDAANEANQSLNNNLDGLKNQFNDKPLPPSLDSPQSMKDATLSLEEPTLIGNSDHKVAQIEEKNDFSLPDDLFVHSNRDAKLTYTATLADGSPLPDWMEFDPENLTISCTPPEGTDGSVEVVIRAEDTRGLTADATVNIKIGDQNQTDGFMADGEDDEEEDVEEVEALRETDEMADAEAEAGEDLTEGLAGEESSDEDVAGNEGENGDAEQNEAAAEDGDAELLFAGEWLQLEAAAAKDAAVQPDAAVHPGLKSQIAATGSDGLMAQARNLVDSLLSR